ncbi:MAG: Lrp/AsnC ligand binding domain-containing protein [Candidatus Methanofastidiosia archaeon]|jgi:DNA-binding Lrp family transcriptional regulator
MLNAYILLTVRIGMLKEALEKVNRMDEVIEADGITGPFDMVVYVGVDGLTELTDTLLHKIERIDGITESMTLVVIEL